MITTTISRSGARKLDVTAPQWLLEGPPGAQLNEMVFTAVATGLTVERSRFGYRVSGPVEVLADLAELVVEQGDSFGIGPEAPPTKGVTVYSVVTPRSSGATINNFRTGEAPTVTKLAPRDDHSIRVTTVHGNVPAAHALITTGIDHGLTVTRVGNSRFEIAGKLGVQVRWWASAQGVTIDEAEAALAPEDLHLVIDTYVDLLVQTKAQPPVEVAA